MVCFFLSFFWFSSVTPCNWIGLFRYWTLTERFEHTSGVILVNFLYFWPIPSSIRLHVSTILLQSHNSNYLFSVQCPFYNIFFRKEKQINNKKRSTISIHFNPQKILSIHRIPPPPHFFFQISNDIILHIGSF